ncbi:hypothetical protein [Micromonospora echinofusca]|uniref:Uncharacterized protein n=1 Tax=Micromonospora echinofusca TaxID=47858 RepID=A0ABS3VXE1_MICEH|nr:hypothetical protein [Micromonospora echinofusca]MBO4209210.1 hypothetical protein [Micromonospora echinofusca]
MTHADREGWSFATAREPARFGLAVARTGPDLPHAYGGPGTLCGIPGHRVEVYLSLFDTEDASACPSCRQRAAAAPTRPCAQERLHDRVLAAGAGPVREDLLAALRQGAAVPLWISGPAAGLARHYARLDRLVEGGPAVVAALKVDTSVGLARVAHEGGEFVVVLPDEGSAVVARATARPAR